MKKLTIAIDGPAGAGKSTVAQIVAQRLQYTYIDTGAMYRAVTWKVFQAGVNKDNTEDIIKIAETINLKLNYLEGKTSISVDNVDVTGAVRTPAVTGLVSVVARIQGVRKAMTKLQRLMAEAGGVVMDGRDIGTHVLPAADIKIFLTASIDERARRRWLELKAKEYDVDFEQLKKDICRRDEMDCGREIAPLIKAEDAVLVDTTALSIAGAVQVILNLCEEKLRGL